MKFLDKKDCRKSKKTLEIGGFAGERMKERSRAEAFEKQKSHPDAERSGGIRRAISEVYCAKSSRSSSAPPGRGSEVRLVSR